LPAVQAVRRDCRRHPAERAGLVAAILTVNFLAFSIPVVIAGWAVTRYGLHRTALVYCVVVAALAAAAASVMVRSRARRSSTMVNSGLRAKHDGLDRLLAQVAVTSHGLGAATESRTARLGLVNAQKQRSLQDAGRCGRLSYAGAGSLPKL